jgi:2,3-bisphosphoglycerate-dependent phosphoglycerate mutase
MMSMTTRIVAVRHGETAWNVDSRVQGNQDIPLNATGRWQAERMSAALVDEGIAAVYSSDLLRALTTAESLGAALALPVVTDTRLRERGFGVFETYTFAEVEARWPAEARRWTQRDPEFAPEGGESLREVYQRSIATVNQLAAAHVGQTIAVVAHGGIMDCLYRAATGLDLQTKRSWPLGNASINRLLHTGTGLTLVGWSDTRHLDEPVLDELPDGDVLNGKPN